MAFTPEQRAEILEVVAENSVTPQDIPQAQSADEVSSLPSIDLNGDYKMVRIEDIGGDPDYITQHDLDVICV